MLLHLFSPFKTHMVGLGAGGWGFGWVGGGGAIRISQPLFIHIHTCRVAGMSMALGQDSSPTTDY